MTFICEACGRVIRFPEEPQRHHKYSNTKTARKYYGKGNKWDGVDWINHPKNIQFPVCSGCNGSHAGQGRGLEVLRELEFCREVGIEPRSKTARMRDETILRL